MLGPGTSITHAAMCVIALNNDNTEQGFSMRMFGNPRRYIVDFEGLYFVATKNDT